MFSVFQMQPSQFQIRRSFLYKILVDFLKSENNSVEYIFKKSNHIMDT